MSGDALPGAPKPTSLSRRTVEDLIFHSAALRRYTQDSPILPDVWFAYGLNPDARIDLLLTPARSDDPNPPGRIADQLARAIERDSKRRQEPPGVLDERLADAKLAYTQSTAAAALTFPEMVAYLLPLCYWRVEGVQLVDKWKRIASMSPAERADLAEQLAQFEAGRPRHGTDVAPLTILWGVRLVGRIALALEGVPESRLTDTPDRARMTDDERAKDDQRRRDLAGQLVEAVAGLIDREAPDDPLVFSVSLNRHAEVSVYRSVPTVKADAARGLFPVDFKGLAWAVIDSGIDATHPAFRVIERDQSGNELPPK